MVTRHRAPEGAALAAAHVQAQPWPEPAAPPAQVSQVQPRRQPRLDAGGGAGREALELVRVVLEVVQLDLAVVYSMYFQR